MGAGHHLNRVQNRMRERKGPCESEEDGTGMVGANFKKFDFPMRLKAKARNMPIMYVTTVYFFLCEKKKKEIRLIFMTQSLPSKFGTHPSSSHPNPPSSSSLSLPFIGWHHLVGHMVRQLLQGNMGICGATWRRGDSAGG